METRASRIISLGFSQGVREKSTVVPYYGRKESKMRFLSRKSKLAGRVGFEPTICGSAGRRLGPGSTTGPRRRSHDSPYNGYNGEPKLTPSNFSSPNRQQFHMWKRIRVGSDMFTCTKCQKREFQMTQLSEMRLLAECAGCGSSFVVDSISDKKSRIEAADPNQHLTWNWKSEQWVPAKRG